MADSRVEIEARALRLPARARAILAERLLASLSAETDAEYDALWLEEAERRLDELESGRVQGIPSNHVLEEARSTLR